MVSGIMWFYTLSYNMKRWLSYLKEFFGSLYVTPSEWLRITFEVWWCTKRGGLWRSCSFTRSNVQASLTRNPLIWTMFKKERNPGWVLSIESKVVRIPVLFIRIYIFYNVSLRSYLIIRNTKKNTTHYSYIVNRKWTSLMRFYGDWWPGNVLSVFTDQ